MVTGVHGNWYEEVLIIQGLGVAVKSAMNRLEEFDAIEALLLRHCTGLI